MRKVGNSVDKLIPVLEAASSKTGISNLHWAVLTIEMSREDGTLYTVYEASTKPIELTTPRARM